MVESLGINNYKSLRDVQFKPKALSVLVGRNDSGKSNLLDAFQFLADLIRLGQKAVIARGGFNTIVWSGNTKEKISFDLHLKVRSTLDSNYYSYRYYIDLVSQPYGSFAVSREFLEVSHEGRFSKLMEFPNASGMASVYDVKGVHLSSFQQSEPGSFLHQLRQQQNDPMGVFISCIQSCQVYDLLPAQMRGPVQAKRELRLAPTGDNLAGVLHTIHSEYPSIFNTIEEYLHLLVPDSRKLLSLLTEEGTTYPGFEGIEIGSRIPASSMSAGTLRFLAFLLVLYSPTAPQLIGLEEPENYIHPHALEMLVEVLSNASKKRQILIATHSPYMLNFVPPESVFVVEKERGETEAVSVETGKKLKLLLRKMGLGEAWYSGTIGGVPTSPE